MPNLFLTLAVKKTYDKGGTPPLNSTYYGR
nr:MAG TPA: hypothetical protein [Bacteriophage sp.]